jgi:CIC family chloride channel protein
MPAEKSTPNLFRKIRLAWLSVLGKLSKAGVSEYTIFTLFSVIIGAAAGLVAVLFHESIELLEFLGDLIRHNENYAIALAGLICLPMLGMGIQRVMIQFAPKAAADKGVMSVIKAVAFRGGHISIRQTIFHFFAPLIAIGTGGTVGPEGPIAKVGAGVSSSLGRLFGMNDARRRMFTTAGAGASIAAIFNTPLGGIFFALELILLNDFRAPIFSALVLASVTASVISRGILGDEPTFIFDALNISNHEQIGYFVLLGLGAGLLSLLYVRYDHFLHNYFKHKTQNKHHITIAMLSVGLMVGITGIWLPQIYGIGYRAINALLAGGLSWQVAFALFVMKFLLVPLTLRSGGYGGTFGPSLVLGASYGYLFVFIGNQLFGLDLATVPFILVGMGAMLGAINSIPISAILILFEMTKDYSFILPLMLGVVMSTTVVQLVFKRSVLNREMEDEGLFLPSGRNSDILRLLQAKDVMKVDYTLVHEYESVTKVVESFMEKPSQLYFTVNAANELTGVIQESELRVVLLDFDHLRNHLVAVDISHPGAICVYPTDDLNAVLKLFDRERCDGVAVVDPLEPRKVIGCITRQDVIGAYNRESMKYNMAEGFAQEFKELDRHKQVQITEGFLVSEVALPNKFVGKSLLQLQLRNKYNVEVLMIKHAESPFNAADLTPRMSVPDPNYQFNAGDHLILFGKEEDLNKIKLW